VANKPFTSTLPLGMLYTPPCRHARIGAAIAFSSEAASGSREENASKQETEPRFRFYQNRNGLTSEDTPLSDNSIPRSGVSVKPAKA
jgi:hypothetical protein